MSNNKISRKDFLSYTALLGAGTLLGGSATSLTSCSKAPAYTPLKQPGEYYIPNLTDLAADGRELKVGVIGCGGRGSGAVVDSLMAANGIKVWALGDVFAERVEELRKSLKDNHGQDVPAENCFVGFDAYKQVILDAKKKQEESGDDDGEENQEFDGVKKHNNLPFFGLNLGHYTIYPGALQVFSQTTLKKVSSEAFIALYWNFFV